MLQTSPAAVAAAPDHQHTEHLNEQIRVRICI